MTRRHSSHRLHLARQILVAMGIPSAAATAAAFACGGTAIIDLEPAAGGSGGSGTGKGTTSSTTTSTSTNSTTSTGGFECTVTLPLNSELVYGCVDPAPDDGCPDFDQVLGELNNQFGGPCHDLATCWCADQVDEFCDCYSYISDVPCGPDPTVPQQCCYFAVKTVDGVCEGRPFSVAGEYRTAEPCRRSDWQCAVEPNLVELDADTRGLLADTWAQNAANEHAAIASFARFVLELLAVGAPAELVWETQKGIAEEIRHAELCYGLASAYAGKPIGPRELDIDGGLEQRTDLVAVALGTFHEGCVNETLSTLLACAQRDAARDPAVKSALSTIAGDEAAHAELAWRFVAWACRRSDDARRAIASSLDALTRLGDEADTAEEPGANEALLRAHGRLPRGERREIIERSLAEVVLPCARALLRGSSVDSGLVVTRAASGTPDQA